MNPEIQATFCADSLATLTQVLKSATAVTTNKNHTSSPVAPGGAPKSEEEEVSNPLIDLLGKPHAYMIWGDCQPLLLL